MLAIEDLRYGTRTISRQAQDAIMEQERRLREATLMLTQGAVKKAENKARNRNAHVILKFRQHLPI